MEVSPAIAETGGYDPSFPAEDTDKDEDEDLCRICRSPEEPGNPLRYPCACRGSIKYVHQDCLRLWLNRRGYKKCEVCGRSYSFVRVYSDNAPERLPCHEFLMGLLLRVSRYVKLIVPWIVLILLNAYCSSLYPWGQEVVVELQRDYGMSWKLAYLYSGLFHCFLIQGFMFITILVRMFVSFLIVRRFPGGFGAGNGLGQRVIAGVVQVLWKYMKILCDWYIYKFIHFLVGERPGLIDIPLNAPLHEFGAIRRMLFFLDDNAFAALAITIYMPIIYILLPFSVGWIVLATVGGSYLYGNSPVNLGYMVMLSVSFAYFGILFTLLRNPFPAIVSWFSLGLYFITMIFPRLMWVFSVKACRNLSISKDAFFVRWFSLGFYFITVIFPCLLWVLSVKAFTNLYIIKDAFVLCLKLCVLPWLIGCWFTICTSPMFGTTISWMFEIFSHSSLMILQQWCMGFMCLTIANSYVDFIQKIIHKRAFWYLLDVTDPDYKICKLNLGYTFFVFASHGISLVILFHLPIKAITLISPSFFPLKLLWFSDEKVDVGAYSVSFYLISSGGHKWLIKLIKAASGFIVHNWIITVSSWLQLSDFLLIVPRGEGFRRADPNVRPLFLFYAIAEGSIVSFRESQNVEDQRDNRFPPRIALMLVLAALSMFLFSTAFMALPILVGRVFFDSTSFIMLRFGLKHDDFCAYWIGCHILRGIYISTCYVSDHIQKGRTDLLIKYISTWIRDGLLFSIWIFVIPGLLGLLIDLMIIIPSRVPLDETPVFFLFQDWLIGVVVLHIWTVLTMLTHNRFATKAWHRKLERIRNEGIDNLPLTWLLRDVIGSMVNTLVTTLCIPYLLVKSVFPLLGYSQSINSAIERFIWPALLALIAVWFIAKLTRDLVVYLHQLIFDERYLVGERVDDLTDDLAQGLIIHGV